METKVFYIHGDLLEMVEKYSTAGRSLYVKISLNLDLLIPRLAGNFLTSLTLYLSRKNDDSAKWRKPLFGLDSATCVSDCTEIMIGMRKSTRCSICG